MFSARNEDLKSSIIILTNRLKVYEGVVVRAMRRHRATAPSDFQITDRAAVARFFHEMFSKGFQF